MISASLSQALFGVDLFGGSNVACQYPPSYYAQTRYCSCCGQKLPDPDRQDALVLLARLHQKQEEQRQRWMDETRDQRFAEFSERLDGALAKRRLAKQVGEML